MESQERRVLERLNIPAYYMSDLDRLGIQRVVEESLARLDSGASSKIHLRQTSRIRNKDCKGRARGFNILFQILEKRNSMIADCFMHNMRQ